MPDKYKAVWVSHSSSADFLKCPRLYYLRNVYKDPRTGHKITVASPALALGQIVHDTIESFSTLPAEERFSIPPSEVFEKLWAGVTGKRGGFLTAESESEYKARGLAMIATIENHPGPLMNKAIKIPQELPHYYLSEEENIILCGKIDWLEYLPQEDAVHIIDFKTGRGEEKDDSLQLPIYLLLVMNTQKRTVAKASYWYLDREEAPREVSLPTPEESYKKVYDVAKRMKLARQIEHFKCPQGGCRYCLPLEDVIAGKGEFIGTSNYNQDIYILP